MNPLPLPSRNLRECGITLREILLLVVLTLMLLAALIPFLRRGKTSSESVAAMNNLVQWGIGLNLYLIEHNNRLPQVGPTQADSTLDDVWYNALPPYLSQAPYSKMIEPGFKKSDNSTIIWSDPGLEKMFGKTGEIFIFPYAMNRFLQPTLTQPAYAIYDVQSPRSVIFLSESASTDPGLLPPAVSYRYDRKPDSPSAIAHVLFLDGHVAPVKREILSAEPTTAAGDAMPEVSWQPFPGALAPQVE